VAPVSYLETGVIYCDDNLHRLPQFPAECVDLIYLDPPFFTNRTYEVIWGDEAEVRSFEDRWEGGIQVFVEWIRERVIELHRILKPTASLYLHCDPTASHYLKVMMDDVFGRENFRNEVIWKRTTAHSSAKRFGPVHDVLLYYARSSKAAWYPQVGPHSEKYLASKYRYEDETGRYRLSDLTGAGIRHGVSGEIWRGFDVSAKGRHWMHQPSELDALDAAGHVYWPPKGGFPAYKRYLTESDGRPLQDVWTDIDAINSQAQERLGYPTQKPEALLERIIGAGSKTGDIVLDPFCGCGTTIAVAERLKRQWIGVDISPTAVGLMKRRMEKLGAEVKLVGMPVTDAQLRALKPFEFQNWVIQRMNGTHAPRRSGDMGIDGYSFLEHLPIQVKQSEKVGRNIVDNFETATRRAGKHKGYIVAFSFGKGAYEEAARARAGDLEIELICVADLLQDVSDLVTPTPDVAQLYLDLLPKARPSAALPSAEELVQSDQRMAAVAGVG
jgi:DNA modification methylase